METRRYINVKTWSEAWFEALTSNEKLVWIYLNTNSTTNMLGVYSTSIRRVAYECHMSEPVVRRSIKKFEDIKKLIYTDEYIILTEWMKQQAMNPCMKMAAQKEYDKLPDKILQKMPQTMHDTMRNTQQELPQPVSCLPVRNPKNTREKEEEQGEEWESVEQGTETQEEGKGTSEQVTGKAKQTTGTTEQTTGTTEQTTGTTEQETKSLQENLPLLLRETFRQAIGNRAWMEQLCMNLRLTPEALMEWLEKFCRKLENEGETRKSIRDFRRHFAAWLNIQLNTPHPQNYHRHESNRPTPQPDNLHRSNYSLPGTLNSTLRSEATQRIEQLRAEGALPPVSHPE